MKTLVLLISCALIGYAAGLAVMSVDFGSEWLKVGIVSPGVPMEIALNKESKRKTPAVISFRDNVRTFGEDAQTIGIRFPTNSYHYLIDLLGKGIDHPIVKLYQERFPYYNIVEDKDRGTILFKHDDETFYSPEELIGQLLHKAKEFAEQSAHQKIKECVITVPGYFNQVERKAMLQAAKLADLKVLQLINDYMAVALNYGIFRSKDFQKDPITVMFYDMGASSTTVSVVNYQHAAVKDSKGYSDSHPQISILGVAHDRTLGGLEIQIRIRDYLAKQFNAMGKTKNDVFKNPRSMAKLFKEAGRIKTILSANNEIYAQIEGLLDEQDFKLLVTREDLEKLVSDLRERIKAPLARLQDIEDVQKKQINQIVVFGGSTRVPLVQEIIKEASGWEISKNINSDEAAAIGAVYKAADLSTGFQVKKFITKDAVLYPITISFQRETEKELKHVTRTLFGRMNLYPQKKIITFNKHTNDFSFNVNYANLDNKLTEAELSYLGSMNLTEIHVKGVADAYKKYQGENVETKGIKAHFNMDDSGILHFAFAELVVERNATEEQEEEGAFSKLGSTISKLFSGEPEKAEKPAEEKQEDEKPIHEDAEPKDEPKQDEKKTDNKTVANETESNNGTSKEEKKKKEAKPKIVTVKEQLNSDEKHLTLIEMNAKQYEVSEKKLKKLADIEKELNRRATALNNLESFVIDAQTKLDEEEYSRATTDEEKQSILKACTEISDWLYEDGADADAHTYESKLSDLKTLTKDLYLRVFEHRERPEALSALNNVLNGSKHFLESARNLTKTNNPEKDVFTDVEIQTLEKSIRETEEWMIKEMDEQNKLKKYEPVKLTVKMISEKIQSLDREVQYLVNKIKIWKPKKTEKPKEVKEKSEEKEQDEEKHKEEEKLKEEEKVKEEDDVKIEDIPAPEEVKQDKSDDDHTEL